MVVNAYVSGRWRGNLLDLLEPGFSPAFRPSFIDNGAFPEDWFEKTGRCGRECTGCGYCEGVFREVCKCL